MDASQRFPALLRPPIAEVVCGVVFDHIPELDPLVLGIYWDSRAAEYPRRSLQPALTDQPGFTIGVFPMRVVLMSEDEQFVLQLQHDRLFVNWRAIGTEYPRFSNRHGPGGLLERATREFSQFGEFVEARLGTRPVPRRLELSKIDLLRRGVEWQDLGQLTEIVPIIGILSEVQKPEGREVNLRFVEHAADAVSIVQINTVMQGSTPTALRIEARRVAELRGSIEDDFERANDAINDVFFKLIPGATEHFGRKGSL